MIIGKGANVIVGEKANVEIKGDLEIQEEANLDIKGQVVIDDHSRKKGKNKKPKIDEEGIG